MSDLPAGWVETTLGEVAETIRGVTYKKAEAASEPGAERLPLLRATNIANGVLELESGLVYVPSTRVSDAQRLSAGDVVIAASSGSRAVVGKSAPMKHEWLGTFGAFCSVARPRSEIDASYFAYLVGSDSVRRRWSGLATGTNINNLKREHFTATPVPLPPLNEQRRIVAAIEEHLSRLDAADASLAVAKRRLEPFRELALAASVDGWPEMPLSEIATTSSGGTPSRKHPEYFGGSIPWVKSGELRDGRVSTTEETITEQGLRESSAKVFPKGTLLIALYGATIGKLGVLDIDAATNQAVCAIKPTDPELGPYLRVALRAKRAELVAAGQGGAQPNISQSILASVGIPLPPLEEQRRIVQEVEERLSAIEALRAAIERAQRRSAALRRAVLERAFRGELVPQDPSDEPAEALLARIRAERRSAQDNLRRASSKHA